MQDYHGRLRSFQPGWWFAKPIGVSPIECAKRGWRCHGQDRIVCECCPASLTIERNDGKWLINGAVVEDEQLLGSSVLAAGHHEFCVWRSHMVDVADPAKLSDREIVQAAERRLESLRKNLHTVPILANGGGGEEDDSAEIMQSLARAGFEFASKSDHNGGRIDVLSCVYCLRAQMVQSFSQLAVSSGPGTARGADGEPAGKAARKDVLPPRDGLYRPRPHVPGGDNTAQPSGDGRSTMDPYALHRFYCPMFSRAHDDLTPLAEKVIKVCVMASTAAAEGGVKDGGFTAAKALELLDSLAAILPEVPCL